MKALRLEGLGRTDEAGPSIIKGRAVGSGVRSCYRCSEGKSPCRSPGLQAVPECPSQPHSQLQTQTLRLFSEPAPPPRPTLCPEVQPQPPEWPSTSPHTSPPHSTPWQIMLALLPRYVLNGATSHHLCPFHLVQVTFTFCLEMLWFLSGLLAMILASPQSSLHVAATGASTHSSVPQRSPWFLSALAIISEATSQPLRLQSLALPASAAPPPTTSRCPASLTGRPLFLKHINLFPASGPLHPLCPMSSCHLPPSRHSNFRLRVRRVLLISCLPLTLYLAKLVFGL